MWILIFRHRNGDSTGECDGGSSDVGSFTPRIAAAVRRHIENNKRVILEHGWPEITSVFRKQPGDIFRKVSIGGLPKLALQIFVKDDPIDSMRTDILPILQVYEVVEAKASIEGWQLTARVRF
jgi:hypothetical protein